MTKKGVIFGCAGVVAGVLLIWSLVDFGPSPELLSQAQRAYERNYRVLLNRRYITLIDYTKPIFTRRLWVLNVATGKTVLGAHVAHAFKSGLIYSTEFSNQVNSGKSCTGAFLTLKDYHGKFGHAMRVQGLDEDNNHALTRAIVFHQTSTLYTLGCFATTPVTNQKIIELVKDGSLVYVAR